MNASTGPSRCRSSCVRTPTWRSQAADFGPTLRILLLSSLAAISNLLIRASGRAQRFHEYTRKPLHAGAIGLVETREARTVDIPHADQPFAVVQGHDNFGARGRIARNMTRKRVDVGDNLRLPHRRRRAAHALAERNAHARRLALERPDDELDAVVEIESGPVQIRQRVVDERREVRRVGDTVSLAMQQATRLFGEFVVKLGLVGSLDRCSVEHRAFRWRTCAYSSR